jgi:hypothetical protein
MVLSPPNKKQKTDKKVPSKEMKTVTEIKPNVTKVCTGINGMCSNSSGEVNIDVQYKNELSQSLETMSNLTAKILDTPYQLILGRPDIKKYKLLKKLVDHFELRDRDGETPTHATPDSAHRRARVPGQPCASDDHPYLNLLIKKDQLLDPEPDDDGIDLKVDEYPWERDDNAAKTPVAGPTIEGPPELQCQLKALLEEFPDIFGTELRTEPADLAPMEIEIDLDKWQTSKNRLPPRAQTRAKEYEIERQLNKMIANNIIKPSQAAYYSQVHLAPKPNGKWRFCLDYIRMNDCCTPMGWPIPNVYQMLQRLGRARAKYFAVIDLTSGYWQAPLSKKSQVASAFITFMGLFEWLRLPMGLKGAGSHFQQQMSSRVLKGLIYHICELYLDDIIVYGRTEEEFLKNLRQVFERLRKHRILLSPEKCRIGLSKVEYVGHMIDETGLSFSENKLREVLDFPLPTTHKGMKSFLGLANYFRDHVKDHSIIVKPLQDMVENYKKNQPLKWTPELSQTFENVKKIIGNCPPLFFMEEGLPIYLHTDASDYGMGAYLFQKAMYGPEQPIEFISKSFTRERLRWSVPEKEAFIIYYALQKLEYLLRDEYFILRTDHKNLTYINSEGSAKVRRWKLAIQEFNFDIEHIAGVDNIVADALSRLCAHTGLEQSTLLSLVEHSPLSKKIYKILSSVHNRTAGHNGVEKTLEKLKTSGTESWPGMREHVKKFISECPVCQKLDYRNVKNHTEPYTTASMEPMETLNIDTIGPVPTDGQGNTYILVIIDCFSRFIELYAVPDTTAHHAARCVLQHLGRYGAPRRIRTDNGSQFVNTMVDELIDMVGSEHQLSLAYSSEENAIVERANKEVMRHLRAILLDKRVVGEWAIYLPLVQRIMNASVHSALQMSPAQIVFGNSITLDRGIFREQKVRKVDEEQIPLSEWAENMQNRQKLILKLAKAAQESTDDFHIVQASAKRTEFPIN